MATVQPIASRKTGELSRLLEERGYGDADFQKLVENPADVLALIDAIKSRESKILEFVTIVTLSAIPSFDAGAHIMVTPEKERKSAELVIGYVGNNAMQLVKGFVEPEVAEATLRIHTLKKPSVDGPIIAELGGEEVVATTWGQMHEMMRRQGRGQQGILSTDGRATVFYIPTNNGVLWAVRCFWYSYYADWNVGADPITYPGRWYGGYQVVSR